MVVFSAAGAGIAAGSALLGGMAAKRANEREQQRFRKMISRRRTSPEGQTLQGAIERLRRMSETLPGEIRANLRQQTISRGQANLQRLNQNLAQRGHTAGGDTFGRAQRGQIASNMQTFGNIENQTGQLESQLLGNLANVSQRAGQYFNPMAMGPEEAYIDPSQILGQAAQGGLLGGYMGWGGEGQQQASQGTPMSLVRDYPYNTTPGQFDIFSGGSDPNTFTGANSVLR